MDVWSTCIGSIRVWRNFGSAYGSRRHRLQWHGSQGCEHWAFCKAVGQAGQVVACPEIMPLVIHEDDSIAWHPTYPDRRRQQLKEFWLQAMR